VIVVVQRVSRAEVRVAGAVVGRIGRGLLLLVGVERGDGEADADVLARKIVALRIFPGRNAMDLALREVGGACLVVSQFTLAGSLHKGNRPSFDARRGSRARPGALRALRRTGCAPRDPGRDRAVRRRHGGRAGQRRSGHLRAGRAAGALVRSE
jgi:D-tyrosyl-tRNA(Tyr) deacylase